MLILFKLKTERVPKAKDLNDLSKTSTFLNVISTTVTLRVSEIKYVVCAEVTLNSRLVLYSTRVHLQSPFLYQTDKSLLNRLT